MIRKLLCAGIIFVLLLFAMTSVVDAHGIPLKSDPPQGAVLPLQPSRVTMWFNLELASGKCVMHVVDATGKQVDLGDAHLDLNDPDHQSVILNLPKTIATGTYTVTWHIVTIAEGHFGHITEGEYAFRYGSGPAPADPAASYAWRYLGEDPSVTDASVGQTQPVANPQLGLLAVLGGLVIVVPVVVVGSLWFLSRRKSRPLDEN